MALAKKRSASGRFSAAGLSVGDAGTITAQLNDFARASAQLYPGGTSSGADLPLTEMAAKMGQAQTRSLRQSGSGFSGVINGDGGTITFAGFETGPAMAASLGNFSPVFNAVHAAGELEKLDMSIYMSTTVADELLENAASSIPERASALLRALVDAWRNSTFGALQDDEKKQVSQIHEANTPALKILKSILDASDAVEIPGLAALAQTTPPINRAVNQYILSLLVQPAQGGYLNNLLAFGNAFGLIYAPEIGGAEAYGKMISVRTAFDAVQDLDADAMTISGVIRDKGIPYTYVIVPRIPVSSAFRSYDVDNKTMVGGQVLKGVVKYPEGAVTGRAYVAEAPPYISGAFGNVASPYAYGRKLSPHLARAGAKELDIALSGQLAAVRTFITGYAKEILYSVRMQGEVVSVSMPLTSKVAVGSVYKVSSGGELFTGLLASVTHNVNSSPRSPAASTSAQFSHVRWKGFTPP